MNSEENKDLEIVMGDDSDLEISEVGDMINDLKPNTSKEKKSIIIPISMNKSQNADDKDEEKEEPEEEQKEDSVDDTKSESDKNNTNSDDK